MSLQLSAAAFDRAAGVDYPPPTMLMGADSRELTLIERRRERVFLILAGLFLGSMTMLNSLASVAFSTSDSTFWAFMCPCHWRWESCRIH